MADSRRHYTLGEVGAVIADRTIPEPNSGCLLWTGSLFQGRPRKSGVGTMGDYGGIRLRGKMTGVHRVVFEIANGPIPEGAQVLHQCDVRLCCNPDHLFLGDNAINHKDKAAKDRGKKRISHAIANEIHKLHKVGHRVTDLARQLGLNGGYTSRLLSGKRRPLAAVSATQE